jgi:hypothetical protein
MFESIIMLLIYLCLIAIVVFIVLWVLGNLGIVIPPRVMQIVWVIVVLIAILFIWRAIGPEISQFSSHSLSLEHGR